MKLDQQHCNPDALSPCSLGRQGTDFPYGRKEIYAYQARFQCENIGMDQETLDFHQWELEQEEVEQVKAALKRADSGHLVSHAKLKEMAAGWCRIEPSRLDQVVIAGRKDARIMWSDATVSGLEQTCEYKVQRRATDGLTTAESYLKKVLSTVELIASYPDVGRPGLVKGTREWGMGFWAPTVAYRYLLGEIQVLGVLVSHGKWPRMRSAHGWWADKKSLS